MARGTRYDEDDDQPRSRRRSKPSGPPLIPIFALIVLMGGAVYLARLAAQNKPEPEEPKEAVKASEIFGDLPVEEPPPRPGGDGSRKATNKAPEGLANNPDFIRAKEIAVQANVVFEAAKKAKSAGDHGEWNIKAQEAKELFDQAFIMTAVWEEELLEKYGDRDRQVKAIMSERNKWIDKVRTLHKTSGRSDN